MRALAAHRPEPLPNPPPTVVIWGTRDPAVSATAHADLAARCDGALVPISGAGHLAYLERPAETVEAIRTAIPNERGAAAA